MNLNYCEVCGVLIQEEGPILLPEGVICVRCFESRRAVVPSQQESVIQDDLVQFHCCYCNSLLRLKTVPKRTRVRCPKCNDAFYLHADGRIEAKLEGGKTAVLQQDDVAPLSGAPMAGDKTQPIKRSDVIGPGRQHKMLEELKPKRLDFVDSLPEHQQGGIVIDTGKFHRLEPAGALDSVPDDAELKLVGDDSKDANLPALRASQEGEVDLQPNELRRKTNKLRKVAPKSRRRKKGGRVPSDRTSHSPKDAETRREEREARDQRARDSQSQGVVVTERQERRTVGAFLAWLAFLLPLGVGIFMGVSSERAAPFTSQGAFGRSLHDLGRSVDDGVRSLDSFLPAQIRLPLQDEAEIATPTSQD